MSNVCIMYVKCMSNVCQMYVKCMSNVCQMHIDSSLLHILDLIVLNNNGLQCHELAI